MSESRLMSIEGTIAFGISSLWSLLGDDGHWSTWGMALAWGAFGILAWAGSSRQARREERVR